MMLGLVIRKRKQRILLVGYIVLDELRQGKLPYSKSVTPVKLAYLLLKLPYSILQIVVDCRYRYFANFACCGIVRNDTISLFANLLKNSPPVVEIKQGLPYGMLLHVYVFTEFLIRLFFPTVGLYQAAASVLFTGNFLLFL